MHKEIKESSIIKECSVLNTKIQSMRKKKYFKFYHTSNEAFFANTLERLADIPSQPGKQIKSAILTGESHVLSILPELMKHADIVFLNDINEQLLNYTKFLYHTLLMANSTEEFIELYQNKELNPLGQNDTLFCKVQGIIKTYQHPNILGKKHFLSSKDRFLACKEAAKKLILVWSNIDLFNANEAKLFKTMIQEHNITVNLMNVSNLHNYDSAGNLSLTISQLCAGNPSPIILYSIGINGPNGSKTLCSKISVGLESYLTLLNFSKTKITPESKEYSISEIKELIAYFNGTIILETANQNSLNKHLLPHMSYQYGLLELVMPKISVSCSKSYLQMIHKITSAMLPWHAHYVEADFLTELSETKIKINKNALQQFVSSHQKATAVYREDKTETETITEHTIKYSLVEYSYWSAASLLPPPATTTFEEIHELTELFINQPPSDKILVLNKLIDKITLYKRQPNAQQLDDILELEENLLVEKTKLMQDIENLKYSYLDM